MYFRCTDCYSATWVQSIDPSGETLHCRECNRGFQVHAGDTLKRPAREQYELALALAESNGLDLPTGYSVLFGMMTLEQAQHLTERGLPARRVEPSSQAATGESGSSGRLSVATPVAEYDPAFADAVAHGYLTIQQAMERGERSRYARKLSERHGLPAGLALLVTDNKIGLTTALRKDHEEIVEVLRPVKIAAWSRALLSILAGLIGVAVGIYGMHVWSNLKAEHRNVEELAETLTTKVGNSPESAKPTHPEPAQQGRIPPRRVHVRKDEFGRLIEIEGPDPSSVLLAFCANQVVSDRCTAVELTDTLPPLPGARLGILRDDAESLHAIRIRKSVVSGRWVAGDGRRPLEATTVPELPDDATRTPVVTR